MPDLEKLYLKLPVSLQNLACSLQGWRIAKTRYDSQFHRKLADARDRSFWTYPRISQFRDDRLRKFVHHAATNVPFYRRQFRELQIAPEDIRCLDDLSRLPVLSKQQVQEHYHEFLPENVPLKDTAIIHTSGTTGAGLQFAATKDALQEQWATWWRYRMWHGITLDTWCGYFAGRSIVPASQSAPPFWRYNYPARQIMFSGYHLSPQNLDAYIGELRRRKPPWLHGYPSILSLLAQYMVENRVDPGYQVRFVTTGAENLLENQSAVLERAFGVKPLQHYGLAEAVANISECDRGALHVDEDFAAVEFVAEGNSDRQRIVGTNFSNFATPLLRYDTQDFASLSSEPCDCGRPGRTVSRIDGRQEDYIVLGNGAKLGRMDHIFKDAIHIREAQIFQQRAGAIVVRIVKGENYSAGDEQALLGEFQQRLGRDCEISFEYHSRLPRSATGKLRFVISGISGNAGTEVRREARE